MSHSRRPSENAHPHPRRPSRDDSGLRRRHSAPHDDDDNVTSTREEGDIIQPIPLSSRSLPLQHTADTAYTIDPFADPVSTQSLENEGEAQLRVRFSSDMERIPVGQYSTRRSSAQSGHARKSSLVTNAVDSIRRKITPPLPDETRRASAGLASVEAGAS